MKIHQLKYLFTGFILAFLWNGCKDEEEFFTGTDNFITAFSLTQDGTTYNASFYSDSIIVTVPDGVSLKGATVSYTLSEHASIIPVPDSISDWENEMLFSVTSYCGEQQIYKYTINRNSIDADGTVILATQDEVDAFGEKGITSIKGSLIIGRMAGKDSITSLAALYELKEIENNLIIRATYASKEFTGFDALETIGGNINIESLENLEAIDFPALKTVGSITIEDGDRETNISVNFPKLTAVTENVSIDEPLNSIDFSSLKNIGGTFKLYDSYSEGEITSVSLPLLENAGSLYIGRFPELTKLQLSALKTTGDFYLYYLPELNVLYCPELLEITGTLTIPSSTSLTGLDLPKLQIAGGLDVTGLLYALDLSSLTEVAGDLGMTSFAVESMDFLSALTTVGGTLTINNFENLKTFTAPSSLKSIGVLNFTNYSTTPPEEINVKGLELGELAIRRGALVNAKLIGDDDFEGTLTIDSQESFSPSGTATFPELEGFSTVDSLSFGSYITTISVMNVEGIKKIRKGLQVPNNNMTEFYLPDLEEVGGDFIIIQFSGSTQETVEIPNLKTVAGDFDVTLNSGTIKTLSFPVLESVGGDFTLATGYQLSIGSFFNIENSLTSALFASLKTINGELSITSSNSSYYNDLMTNLDGFSSLTSVKSVNITKQSALVSYEGLKNALSSFSSDDWYVSDNAYNPTYDELSNGNWTQE